jgi:hypothetical protein
MPDQTSTDAPTEKERRLLRRLEAERQGLKLRGRRLLSDYRAFLRSRGASPALGRTDKA